MVMTKRITNELYLPLIISFYILSLSCDSVNITVNVKAKIVNICGTGRQTLAWIPCGQQNKIKNF